MSQPITIWGAGAIGGVVGAWTAEAGIDVLLVDTNAEHVDAINADGLRITGMRGEHHVRVPAARPDEVRGPLDRVLLAVKCQHTGAALGALAPRLAPDGYVVSLQNGLNERTIAAAVGAERTVGCFVNFSADWLAPGLIEFGGEHPLYVGELDGRRGPRIEGIADLLRTFGETVVTDNIWGYLWSKLCFAVLLFGTALVDAPIYEVVRRPGADAILYDLVAEATAVPRALGIRFEELAHGFRPEDYHPGGDVTSTLARVAEFYEGQTKVKSGIWRDLAVRHRTTEVDCQVGALVDAGRQAGLDLPLTSRLVELVHDLETGRRPMDWSNIDAIKEAQNR